MRERLTRVIERVRGSGVERAVVFGHGHALRALMLCWLGLDLAVGDRFPLDTSTVSVVGAYGPIPNAVKFGDALNKGLTLRMNQTPVKRQWPRMFEHVRNGFLTPRQMVTHRFSLEEIPEAYHVFSSKLDGCIKPLILPSAA